MTLDQLRIFLAVAEREHITRAAEALNLTPSATSAAITALETRHAVKLFDRIGRRIVLNDAGRSFRDEAQKLLAQASRTARMLDDLAGLKRGHLRIAASQTVGNYWLPSVLARFRLTYPGIALEVLIGNSGEVAQLVHDLAADLGVIEGPCDDPQLATEPLSHDQMVLVRAPDQAPPFDPQSQIWVLREQGSGTRAIFDQWLAAQGLELAQLPPPLELPSNEAVRTAVEAGLGASILSQLVVAPALDSGRLCALPATLPARPFSLLRHRERPLTRAEAAFEDLVRVQAP